MNYFWYRIFNEADFNNVDYNAKTYTLNLEGLGLRRILVTKKKLLGITYEDTYLPLSLNNKNPFYFNDKAIFKNSSGNVFLGFRDDS